MIFHPSIIALYLSSLLLSFMICYASYYGVQILLNWDIRSGSELQLALERKTYLISTLLTYLFGFELVSLFLYIYTTDQLHTLFVGAMCAAGSLKVNDFGYPALLLKAFNFLLAGLWLILNFADNRGYDYPLIKKKYSLLLAIAPLILVEMILQANYFLRLEPNIITSCCGSLFSIGEEGMASELASLPSIPMKVVFYLCLTVMTTTGLRFYRTSRGGYLFSAMSGITFVVSIVSMISFISLYYYELPTHHCPFCILQKEYEYIGYPLYVAIFGSGVCGLGVGILMPFRSTQSLRDVLPSIQKRLTLVSLVLILLFAAMVTYQMVFSDFRLEGY
jgi:hypothetical protein